MSLLLIMRMIPVVALAIPLFVVFAKVGMLDTLSALILTHTAAKLPIAIWLLMGFIQDLPKEIEESALMDGAGTLRILVQIVSPLIAPGIGASAVITFLFTWNDLLIALDPDVEREGADAAGRPHQLRIAVRDRLGRDVRCRRPHGHPDADFRLVRARVAREGAGRRSSSRLTGGATSSRIGLLRSAAQRRRDFAAAPEVELAARNCLRGAT